MPDVWFDQGCAWLGTGVGNPFAEIGDDLGIALGAELATSDYVIEDGFASLTEAPGLGVTIDEDALCTLNSMPLPKTLSTGSRQPRRRSVCRPRKS